MKTLLKKVFCTKALKHKIGEKFTRIHQHYRYDAYNEIKTSNYEMDRIITRENENFAKWKKYLSPYQNEWESLVFSKSLSPMKEIREDYKNNEYFNVTSREGYDILKRKDKASGKVEVVFDMKTVPFIKNVGDTILKGMRLSPNQKKVSFVLDMENNERYFGGIYDIESKKYYRTGKEFHNVSLIEFTNHKNKDGEEYVIYVQNDSLNRPYRIMCATFSVDKEPTEPIILFEEKDKNVYIETNPTKDSNYLVVNLLTKDDSEVRILNLTNIFESSKKLFSRVKGVKYFIEHTHDKFFILSNYITKKESNPNCNYKLFTMDSKDLSRSKLELKINPEVDEYFEDMDILKDHIIIYMKKNLHPYVLVYDVNKDKADRIKIGSTVGEIKPGANQAYDSKQINLEYSSPIIFKQVFSLNTEKLVLSTLDKSVISGVDEKNYEVREIMAPAKDGEEIPLTIFYKKGMKLNRKNKTLLVGYGAYGLNLELNYDQVFLSAVDKGWVVAYAHLRGGHEKGREWHEKGRLLNKSMVIEDYLACAYELIQHGYTHPNYLAGYGESAGGAVVAQAVNLKPDMFRAVVLSHPFVDILSTLLDDSFPLTITDYLEYGNPYESKDSYFNIYSLSPYENISIQEYPAMFISMSLDDPRVPSWGTLKYIEKLRQKALPPTRLPNFITNNICVRIEKSGHFGPVSQNESLKNKTWELMWLDKMLIEKDNVLI